VPLFFRAFLPVAGLLLLLLLPLLLLVVGLVVELVLVVLLLVPLLVLTWPPQKKGYTGEVKQSEGVGHFRGG
jgi:hypothetical protein